MMRAHAHELLALIGATGYGRVASLQVDTGRPPKPARKPRVVEHGKPRRLGGRARAELAVLKDMGGEVATADIAAIIGQDRDDTLKTMQRLRDFGFVENRVESMRVPCVKSKGGWRTSSVALWRIKEGAPCVN